MEVRSLAFGTDLALLQHAGTVVEDRGDHLVVRTPGNPMFWWGNFLLLDLTPAPDRTDHWLQVHRAEFPTAEHVAIGIDTASGTAAGLAVFAARGLDVQASTVLTASRVQPPRSRHPSATYRPLAGDEDWEHSVQLTLRCAGSDEETFTRRRWQDLRRVVEGGHGRWFGAFVGERLVAQLGLLDAGGGLARFQNVETEPDLRRQGLAGPLVHTAYRWGLDELGARMLVMVADPEYVAVDLYRALGFTDTETQVQAAGRR